MAGTSTAQRDVLERLLDLTGDQKRALDDGDIAGINELSQLRLKTVIDAAAFLPPQQPWSPDVVDLAEAVQRGTTSLQQDTRACMAVVRRQLAQLTENRQAVQYLGGQPDMRRASWKG